MRLLAPVLPSKVIAVGGNYAGHPRELSAGEVEPAASGPGGEPVLYLKPSTSVVGHGDEIAYPVKLTQRVDYEGEMAVIIGGRAVRCPPLRPPRLSSATPARTT